MFGSFVNVDITCVLVYLVVAIEFGFGLYALIDSIISKRSNDSNDGGRWNLKNARSSSKKVVHHNDKRGRYPRS